MVPEFDVKLQPLGVVAAQESPKLLVGVRFSQGLPEFSNIVLHDNIGCVIVQHKIYIGCHHKTSWASRNL